MWLLACWAIRSMAIVNHRMIEVLQGSQVQLLADWIQAGVAITEDRRG